MGKSKTDKKINRKVRKINKALEKDVYKDRFLVQQVRKTKQEDINYYIYMLCDKKCPERNRLIGWYSDFELLTFHDISIEMNKFIIESDFWRTYEVTF